ncbi:aspartate aminotransferase family protein [Acaryochloris thomasi]|uniref:aspartate aminotransferase family protein n=1 Tax=Acaryochloris thomasi TaxID=2929456 RepID=UPI0028F3F501|nr:aspartate aminotransferase family protein [Acaryochloris thomasi]
MSPTNLAPVPTTVIASFDATEFDRHVMGTYGRFPIALERGEGCRVWDTVGKEYLDFVAGIATCTLGHAHPALIEAVTTQIQKLHHVSNLYYIPEQGELAQWLTEHSCADRAFFCNSGAEANEAAIKLARKYGHTVLNIKNPVIVTANASFHGRTLATITATGQPKYQKNFNPLVPGFHYVPFNDFEAMRDAIATLNQPQPQVAAILLEPLQGEGGVNPGNAEYFQKVRQLCDQHGILLILDEVQVGMGRTGKLWGYENLGIEPDIFTLAKGLAGGIPIGAMLCKESCNIFEPGDHASTFGGNPFASAAALCVCQTLETESLIENVRERGEQLRSGLTQLAAQYPHHISEIRGWGLINGMVLAPSLKSIDVVKAAMEAGLLLVPAGPQVVRFVPPLVVSAEEVESAIAIIQSVFTQLCA